MKQTSPAPRAAVLFALSLFSLLTILAIGCSSDDTSTAPGVIASTTASEIGGEVPLPETHDAKLPRPSDFRATVLHRDCIRLNWDLPAIGYTAMIGRDGMLVATLDARTGYYIDEEPLAVGEHVYELCFGRCNSMGTPARVVVNILPETGRGDRLVENE